MATQSTIAQQTQQSIQRQIQHIRLLIGTMIIGLIISGITAIPLQWGIQILTNLFGPGTLMQHYWPAMTTWLTTVREAILTTDQMYPLLFYGTDWLAFAHIVIAIAFIGPFRDPVRNIWVIEFGMIACILVLPMALIFGPIRGIPFFWQLIDCSFGIFGFLPLWFTRRSIIALEKAQLSLLS